MRGIAEGCDVNPSRRNRAAYALREARRMRQTAGRYDYDNDETTNPEKKRGIVTVRLFRRFPSAAKAAPRGIFRLPKPEAPASAAAAYSEFF
jgi:hypothetical protein